MNAERLFRMNERTSHLRFGFVILNYERPDQLLRMAQTLRRLFPDASIVCNHDFAQCPLDRSRFANWLDFLDPWIAMKWGHISCVRAALAGFEWLLERGKLDWVFLVSGATYPIKSRAEFERQIASAGTNALIHSTPVPIGGIDLAKAPHWAEIHSRYLRLPVLVPAMDRSGRLRRARREVPLPRIARGLLPFHQGCRLHSGGFWFSCDMDAARHLVESPARFRRLYRHAARVRIPEEMVFHTVLANTPEIRWRDDDLHFIKWPPASRNPRRLQLDDWPEIRESSALWARKIMDGEDGGLLDTIDRTLFE